jgi:hypothetical protein
MLHLESVLTGRMLGMVIECSVSHLHDAFGEAGLYHSVHKVIEARVCVMSSKLKLSQVSMCSCICQALGSSRDMSGVLLNCQDLNPDMWEHFGPRLREHVIALGTSRVRPDGLFSATAWCNIAKVVVILDNFRCACFALPGACLAMTACALTSGCNSCTKYPFTAGYAEHDHKAGQPLMVMLAMSACDDVGGSQLQQTGPQVVQS